MTLAGKTVLVTGAAGGIGSAIARRFAKEQAKLVLLGRDQQRLDEVLSCCRQPDQEPDHHKTRIIDDIARPLTWHQTASAYPGVDILVNCIGYTENKLLWKLPDADIQNIVSVNLTATILACKWISQRMARKILLETKGQQEDLDPSIINVSSLLALKGQVGASVYAASKAGIVSLTKTLALELARSRIRVNAVLPGYISTPMTEALPNQTDLFKQIPLGRFGTPDEVADAVLFLAKNKYANGTILNLDGGLGAR